MSDQPIGPRETYVDASLTRADSVKTLTAEVAKLRLQKLRLLAALELARDNLQCEFGTQSCSEHVRNVVDSAIADTLSEDASS